ncbi:hypothetical protein LAD64_24195 [Klebsiella pneumoniae]|nr:hypothetical protein [Klebsiella pneumoniae]
MNQVLTKALDLQKPQGTKGDGRKRLIRSTSPWLKFAEASICRLEAEEWHEEIRTGLA